MKKGLEKDLKKMVKEEKQEHKLLKKLVKSDKAVHKKLKKQKGAFDPISLVIIVACMSVGGYFYFKSQAIDHPVEQIAEEVLDGYGLDLDFSKQKKDAKKQ